MSDLGTSHARVSGVARLCAGVRAQSIRILGMSLSVRLEEDSRKGGRSNRGQTDRQQLASTQEHANKSKKWMDCE